MLIGRAGLMKRRPEADACKMAISCMRCITKQAPLHCALGDHERIRMGRNHVREFSYMGNVKTQLIYLDAERKPLFMRKDRDTDVETELHEWSVVTFGR